MTTTPITPSSLEALSQYMQALSSFNEVLTSVSGKNDAESEAQRFTALLILTARAEALEKTSTLVWRDEEGNYVAPNAGPVISKLIIVMQDHPEKGELFPEVLDGNTVTPTETDMCVIDGIIEDFAEKPEAQH